MTRSAACPHCPPRPELPAGHHDRLGTSQAGRASGERRFACFDGVSLATNAFRGLLLAGEYRLALENVQLAPNGIWARLR